MQINAQRNIISAVTRSYEQHMDRLANIAKHDIGNAVQNMFASLKLWKDKVDDGLLGELELSLDNLNSTLTHFGQLIPYNVKEYFILSQMMEALVVLTRSDIQSNQIQFFVTYDKQNKDKIYQPFQPILQMLHNLILNAEKSFVNNTNDKIIYVESNILNDCCVIKIKDNGDGIDDSIVDSIFDYGFTTTNGNGIGLAHARYLCEEIGAEISIRRFTENFSTIFTIIIPLRYDSKKGPCH